MKKLFKVVWFVIKFFGALLLMLYSAVGLLLTAGFVDRYETTEETRYQLYNCLTRGWHFMFG